MASTGDTKFVWNPVRSAVESQRVLTGPGMPHEMENAIIDGRVLRVYKNLPPNLRFFWLGCSSKWEDKDYMVYEQDRYTYARTAELVSRLANVLYTNYSVRKGDRVAIAMRNFPEYLISFWAAHLVGAVPALVNAWLPPDGLAYCITNTDPKVVIVDAERADSISGRTLDKIKQDTASLRKVLVVRPHDGKQGGKSRTGWRWTGMASFDDVLKKYSGPDDAWGEAENPQPDDDATIFFTSGTTGLPKGVLSSQRSFLSNLLNASMARLRTTLMDGQSIEVAPADTDEQRAVLLSAPLFHVTGLTGFAVLATALGSKIVLMRKWVKEEAVRLILTENISIAGGVPATITDIIDSSLQGSKLEGLSVAGAPPTDSLTADATRRFPKIDVSQAYGLSETNGVATAIFGKDYLSHPRSAGLPAPVCDVLIVHPETLKILPPGEVGEIWIKGSNIMRGYWRDPVATEKTITRDGWFRSGDLGCVDEEGYLYVKDRLKDMIIRGGENIHSVEVENAIYKDERVLDVAVVSVPDKQLGELVAALVSTKPEFQGKVTEEEIIANSRKSLPAFAVPVFVVVQDEPIERNAAGKIVKDVVRKKIRELYKRRSRRSVKAKL